EKLAGTRSKLEDERLGRVAGAAGGMNDGVTQALQETKDRKEALDLARRYLSKERGRTQVGKLGVDLSVQSNQLRYQTNLSQSALRKAAGKDCLEVGGVWIDQDFDDKMPTLAVKAQSDAYFRILERQPKVKEAFQLGNYLVWVTPNRT